MNDDVQKVEDNKPSPPSPLDGPDEEVDWTELEEEGHPTVPEGSDDDAELR